MLEDDKSGKFIPWKCLDKEDVVVAESSSFLTMVEDTLLPWKRRGKTKIQKWVWKWLSFRGKRWFC